MLDNSNISERVTATQPALADKEKTHRYSHRDSFFLHLRPKNYQAGQIAWKNTRYLGFLAVFFLVLECVTGAILMVYYVPSSEAAYESIVRLHSQVPFGWLMRDLHRLGGECMVAVVALHLVRVFLAGTYKGKAVVTWMTGVALLLCTLVLAFSGYLLPWDQLAFWAVTIGTSMADTIPGIGGTVSLLLRGGQEIAQDGLLRFYLLHIVGVPVVMAVFLAIHYYRVARLHGISCPRTEASVVSRRVPFLPNVAATELCLSLFTLVLLIAACTWFYDAPFEHHADPRHTPAATKAPWFFLWLQGALKLGDSFLMGVGLPAVLLTLLLLVPVLDFSSTRGRVKLLVSRSLVGLVAVLGIGLSLYGFPQYGIEGSQVSKVLQSFAPEEGVSPFQRLGYSMLPVGLYGGDDLPSSISDTFRSVHNQFFQEVGQLEGSGGIEKSSGILIVEEWQAGLKRVSLRVHTVRAGESEPKSREATVFIYDRDYGNGSDTPVVKDAGEGNA